jgi:hypothetical protein
MTCKFFNWYKIILWFFTRFKYLNKFDENFAEIHCFFPLLLHGMGTILSSVREISHMKKCQKSIILEIIGNMRTVYLINDIFCILFVTIISPIVMLFKAKTNLYYIHINL